MAVAACIQFVTLTCIIWALWVRRVTWACKWEKAATVSIALDGAGLFLTGPAGRATVGAVLHEATGYWNLAILLGHTCYIASGMALSYSLLSRLSRDAHLRGSFRRWVRRPAVATLLALMAVFAVGGCGMRHLYTLSTAWERGYWAIMSIFAIYLFGYACAALLTLMRYPRHRTVAGMYLAACISGLLSSLARLVTVLPIEPPALSDTLIVLLTSIWMTGYAAAASYSWHAKTRGFRKLEAAVRL